MPLSPVSHKPMPCDPMERALRVKKAAIQTKPKPPGAAKGQRERAAGIAAGASKPWMKR